MYSHTRCCIYVAYCSNEPIRSLVTKLIPAKYNLANDAYRYIPDIVAVKCLGDCC